MCGCVCVGVREGNALRVSDMRVSGWKQKGAV